MKIVLIGDIGWPNLYHLGDEAMTEAAIQMLQQRGLSDITLIAGDPAVSSAFYGLPAVPRIGFSGKWSRSRLHSHLSKVTDGLRSSSLVTPPTDVITAVEQADAVVIAGGGNMNSQHVHHLFERAALARIAKFFGKPLFVSSQTVGPKLKDGDRSLVAEIVEYATLFGARERPTHGLVQELSDDPQKIVHTMDDAILLEPTLDDRAFVSGLSLGDRYVVGSFASYSRNTGMTEAAYYERIASVLDEISDRLHANVVLAPHAGSFNREVRKDDMVSHDEILRASHSGRVVSLDMMTARQVIALTETAILSISTRYHPTVFGPGVGTPTTAIAASYYSSVRMRGALTNVGLADYGVPIDVLNDGPYVEMLCDLVARSEEFRQHTTAVVRERRTEQHAWWDAIVAAIHGSPVVVRSLLEVSHFRVPQEWRGELASAVRVSDRLGIEQIDHAWEAEHRRHLETRIKDITSREGERRQDWDRVIQERDSARWEAEEAKANAGHLRRQLKLERNRRVNRWIRTAQELVRRDRRPSNK